MVLFFLMRIKNVRLEVFFFGFWLLKEEKCAGFLYEARPDGRDYRLLEDKKLVELLRYRASAICRRSSKLFKGKRARLYTGINSREKDRGERAMLEIEKIEARGHDRTIWSTPLTPTWRAGVLAQKRYAY